MRKVREACKALKNKIPNTYWRVKPRRVQQFDIEAEGKLDDLVDVIAPRAKSRLQLGVVWFGYTRYRCIVSVTEIRPHEFSVWVNIVGLGDGHEPGSKYDITYPLLHKFEAFVIEKIKESIEGCGCVFQAAKQPGVRSDEPLGFV